MSVLCLNFGQLKEWLQINLCISLSHKMPLVYIIC